MPVRRHRHASGNAQQLDRRAALAIHHARLRQAASTLPGQVIESAGDVVAKWARQCGLSLRRFIGSSIRIGR